MAGPHAGHRGLLLYAPLPQPPSATVHGHLVESVWCDCCWKVCQAPTTTLISWIFSAADSAPRSTCSRCAMAPTSAVASSHVCRGHDARLNT